MDELWYIALAYGVIWVGLMGYLAYVSRQALSVREELNVYREVLATEGQEDEPDWEDEDADQPPEAVSDGEVARGGRATRGEV